MVPSKHARVGMLSTIRRASECELRDVACESNLVMNALSEILAVLYSNLVFYTIYCLQDLIALVSSVRWGNLRVV